MRTRTDCQMQIKATYLFTYLYIYTLMLVLWYFVTYMQTYLCSYFHAYILPSIHAVYALVFNRYLCKRTYGHTQSVISLICLKKGGGLVCKYMGAGATHNAVEQYKRWVKSSQPP